MNLAQRLQDRARPAGTTVLSAVTAVVVGVGVVLFARRDLH